MNNNISNRDKILLAILVLVVLVYAFFTFVYQPLSVEVEENKVLLDDYQTQQAEMISTISRYGRQDETINQLEDNIETKLEGMSEYQDAEDLQDYVANLADGLGVDFTSFFISDYEQVTMDVKLDEESLAGVMGAEEAEATSYAIKDYVCTIYDCTDELYYTEAIPSVVIEKISIRVSFESSRDSYKQYLDRIDEDGKTLVLSDAFENIYTDKTNTYELALEVYTVKGR